MPKIRGSNESGNDYVILAPQPMHTPCPQSGPSHKDIVPVPESQAPKHPIANKGSTAPENLRMQRKPAGAAADHCCHPEDPEKSTERTISKTTFLEQQRPRKPLWSTVSRSGPAEVGSGWHLPAVRRLNYVCQSTLIYLMCRWRKSRKICLSHGGEWTSHPGTPHATLSMISNS